MAYLNTGYKIVTRLRQVAVYADSHRDPTGVTKPNDPEDSDYIAPYINTTSCPIPPPCGTPVIYSGGVGFPNTSSLNIGTDTGTVWVRFGTGHIPDKMIITQLGVVKLDTGYCGDPIAYQSILDAALAARGLPPETIVDNGATDYISDFSFVKSVANQFLTINIYSPIDGTQWNFTVYCPGDVPPTTTTTTSTTTTTAFP